MKKFVLGLGLIAVAISFVSCPSPETTGTPNPCWRYRQAVTINGSSDGNISDYQLELRAKYNGTIYYPSLYNSPPASNDAEEITAYATYNGSLYWGGNYVPSGEGYIYKTVLATNVTSVIYNGNYLEEWQGVRVGDNIYTVGNEGNGSVATQRSSVHIINTVNDSVIAVKRMDTGNCNELVGVDTDGTYLYAGEMQNGGDPGNSSWPSGGGFWRIPISTVTNTSTWERTWEDPNNWFWSTVAYFNGTVYGFLTDYDAFRVVSSPANDLVNWANELDYTAQSTGIIWDGALVKCNNSLVALAAVAATGTYHMFIFDGASWTDYDLGMFYIASTDIWGLWHSSTGQLAVVIGNGFGEHTIYSVNLNGTNLTYEYSASGFAHIVQSDQGFYTEYNGNMFYGTTMFGTLGVYELVVSQSSYRHTILLDGKCKSDFSDIRFTKADGTIPLDYWLGDYTTGESADFWVEIDSIPANNSTTIYVYYGNPAATSLSNGENTFIFFDDFSTNLSKWDVAQGSWSIIGGKLGGYDDGTGAAIYSNLTYPIPASGYKIGGRLFDTTASAVYMLGISPQKDVLDPASGYYSLLDYNPITPPPALLYEAYWDGLAWNVLTSGVVIDTLDTQRIDKLANGDFLLWNGWVLVDSVNDVSVIDTGNNWYIRAGIGFTGYSLPPSNATFDDIWVGKHTEHEPYFAAWGDEETLSCPTPTPTVTAEPGDVNDDGRINCLDITQCELCILYPETYPKDNYPGWDANEDDEGPNAGDILAVEMRILGTWPP